MKWFWNYLYKWCDENDADSLYLSFPDPVDPGDFAAMKSTIGTLPPLSYQELLKTHNGGQVGRAIVWGADLSGTSEIIHSWNLLQEAATSGEFSGKTATSLGPVKPLWWNDKWIPFAYRRNGNYFCFDMDPANGGQIGQIIRFDYENPAREVLAPDLESWLRQYINDLRADKYMLDIQRIVPRKHRKH